MPANLAGHRGRGGCSGWSDSFAYSLVDAMNMHVKVTPRSQAFFEHVNIP